MQELVGLAIFEIAMIIPATMICWRVGKTRWLAGLMLLFPIGLVIFLFVIAYGRWTIMPTRVERTTITGSDV
jgi:hypothetical protein